MGCVHGQLDRERSCQRMGKGARAAHGPGIALRAPIPFRPYLSWLIRTGSTFAPWLCPAKLSTRGPARHPTYSRVTQWNLTLLGPHGDAPRVSRRPYVKSPVIRLLLSWSSVDRFHPGPVREVLRPRRGGLEQRPHDFLPGAQSLVLGSASPQQVGVDAVKQGTERGSDSNARSKPSIP